MNLGKYIKQSNSRHANQYSIERKCLQCGSLLENEGTPLYYQKFCSKTCKERYVGMPLDN